VSSRVQAVCDWFGPTDLTKIDTRAWYKALRIDKQPATQPFPGADHRGGADSFEGRLLGGAPSNLKEKAVQASPITRVSKDDPPFLIMHGDRDPMMSLAQSEILRDALKKAGVDVKLHIVRGAGHGFDGTPIMDTVRQFFDEHLKGKRASQRKSPRAHASSTAMTAIVTRMAPIVNRQLSGAFWPLACEVAGRAAG